MQTLFYDHRLAAAFSSSLITIDCRYIHRIKTWFPFSIISKTLPLTLLWFMHHFHNPSYNRWDLLLLLFLFVLSLYMLYILFEWLFLYTYLRLLFLNDLWLLPWRLYISSFTNNSYWDKRATSLCHQSSRLVPLKGHLSLSWQNRDELVQEYDSERTPFNPMRLWCWKIDLRSIGVVSIIWYLLSPFLVQ